MKYSITFVFEYWFDASGYYVNRIETRKYENLNEDQFKDTLMLLLKETTSILEIEVKTSWTPTKWFKPQS